MKFGSRLAGQGASVGTMIGYNRKSFIYMQPINDRMEFSGIDYNRKIF